MNGKKGIPSGTWLKRGLDTRYHVMNSKDSGIGSLFIPNYKSFISFSRMEVEHNPDQFEYRFGKENSLDFDNPMIQEAMHKKGMSL